MWLALREQGKQHKETAPFNFFSGLDDITVTAP